MSENATLLEILRKATAFLAAQGCDAPRLEAEILLARGLDTDRLGLYLQFDRELAEPELDRCRALLVRRGGREPLAYILGEKEFRSLTFEVDPRVFVPRPETETLVEEVLRAVGDSGRGDVHVADVGSGSGCIAISLARALPAARFVATDRSAAALEVARRNAHRHGVAGRTRFVRTDFLSGVAGCGFDVVASNPPYVLPSERDALPPELAFEPADALFAPHGDVGAVYEKLAREARRTGRSGGVLVVEIGEGQAPLVSERLVAEGLVDIRAAADLGGTPRVLSARIP